MGVNNDWREKSDSESESDWLLTDCVMSVDKREKKRGERGGEMG